MAVKAPTFAVGDAVCLKGQAPVMTVVPRPDGAIQKDDWLWVAYACQTGIAFSLLPIECLVKKAPRR